MILQENGSHWERWLQQWFYPLLITGIAVNAGALFITILEPDGALYASIARTMAQTGDFINLKAQGNDWLDKPHFPFWTAALSFKLFGINTFAYKFPALLFWATGAWYTYRLAYTVYGKPVAQLSTLIYISAAHLVISNNDVRAEPYLTGLVAGSVFHFYKASRQKISGHLVAGSLLAAMAMMTKGPFILITIAAGFIVHWTLKKEWHQFVHFRWLIALALIFIFIMPELYALYLQFDSHPEKTVFGKTHVSGIRFFFWDSQFGRFFNTGPIRGSGDPFFYFHTLLWAFLPWSLLLYAALFKGIRDAVTRAGTNREFITLGASLVSFIVFSLSKFQLPHYLNMLFPFFAILTAQYMYGIYKEGTKKIIWWVLHVIIIVLLMLVFAITFCFRFQYQAAVTVILLALSIPLFFVFRHKLLPTAFARCFVAAMIAYAFINFLLYPALLKYQSGSEAAFVIRDRLKWRGPVYLPTDYPLSYSLEFYLPQTLQFSTLNEVPHEAVLFVPENIADSLINSSEMYELLARLPHFHISQLTGAFINSRTRQEALEYNRLLIKH